MKIKNYLRSLVLICFSILSYNAKASPFACLPTQEYRVIQGGDWNDPSIWETFNGCTWVAATSAPTDADSTITITGGFVVEITDAVTANQVTVESEASLEINGGTLTITDGIGNDLMVSGTFNLINGTLKGDGNVEIFGGGNFNWTGGIMDGTGVMDILSGASVSVSSPVAVLLMGTRSIINSSTNFIISDNGSIFMNTGTVFKNTADGVVTIINDGGFSFGGGAAIITNLGTITKDGGSGISYLGNDATMTFNNLGTVNVNTGTIQLEANGTNSGTYTIATDATLAGGISMSFTGTAINNNGSITLAGLSFNGTTNQQLNGVGSIYNLTLNNSAGLTLGGNQTLYFSLTFSNGRITTGESTLALAAGVNVSGTGNSRYVNGTVLWNIPTGNNVSRTFPIGDANKFTPAKITFANVSTVGVLIGKSIPGDHPNIATSGINPNRSVNRYWRITNNNVVFTTYSATFTFAGSDEDGSTDPNSFLIKKWDGATWESPTMGTLTSNSSQATGLTSFSEFQIGEAALCLYYLDADNDGFGNSAIDSITCTQPIGYVLDSTDCDDNDNSIYHIQTVYVDADGDGYDGGTAPVCMGTDAPSGYSLTTLGHDCDDTNESIYALQTIFVDHDGDGYTDGTDERCMGVTAPTGYSLTSLGHDCDDDNVNIWTRQGFYDDEDGDGYDEGIDSVCWGALPPPTHHSTTTLGTDCDDHDPTVWQSQSLYLDYDQDGYSWDLNTVVMCFGASLPAGYSANTLGEDCNDENVNVFQTGTFYIDNDGDGYDHGSESVCYGSTTPVGYSTTTSGTDCDDNDFNAYQSNTLYIDGDGDGYDSGTATVCYGSAIPAGYSSTTSGTDCNDADFNAYQSATVFIDGDGDGYDAGTATVCYGSAIPAGYSSTTSGTDCNDADFNAYQSATVFIDGDGDGYDAGTATVCYGSAIPAGYSFTTSGTDCDDADFNAYQSATVFIDGDGDGYDAGTTTICYGSAIPAGYSFTTSGTDCDDADFNAYQSATLYIDGDGDGYDAGTTTVCYGSAIPAGYASTTSGADCDDADFNAYQSATLYIDGDNDGYDAGNATICYGASIPAGYSSTTNGRDCNDANLAILGTTPSNQSLTICNGDSYSIGIHNYNTAGIYIDTIPSFTGCDSIITTDLSISPLLSVFAGFDQTVCDSSTTSLTGIVSGGTGALSFNWTDGTNTFSTLSFTINPETNALYTLTVTDAINCSSSDEVAINVINSTDVYGHVTYSGGDVTSGAAVLYRWAPPFTLYDRVKTVFIGANGYYHFPNIVADSYLIKVFPNEISFPNLVKTYYNSEYMWDSSVVANHTCNSIDTFNIQARELEVIAGTGFLSGHIFKELSFGRDMMSDPIPGVDVKVGRNPSGALAASTTTSNPTGYYEFPNLAFGTYIIYVDLPGLDHSITYTVTLDASNPSAESLDFCADSVAVPACTVATGITQSNSFENSFILYPNPSNGTFVLESRNNKITKIEVYNIIGEKVLENNLNKSIKAIDLSTQQKGVYIIKITDDQKNMITKKAIIQ